MASSCPDHPSRAVTSACRRCGRFLCDWCEKLAPSWGPGLCGPCQSRVGAVPRARQLGGLLMVFASWLLFSLFGPFVEVRRTLASAAAWTAWEAGAAAIDAAVLAGTAVIAWLFVRRKKSAPQAIRVYLLVRLALTGLNLAALAVQGQGRLLAFGIFWEATIGAWLVYFFRSERVKETFAC